MFRHKERLILTQFVLIVAGCGFLMVMSLISSISLTLDNVFARQHYDMVIQFEQDQRQDRTQALAYSIDGVNQTELRFIQSASMFVEGQLVKEAGVGSNIEGIPASSDFYSPLIVAGRWFASGDGRVIVITRNTAKKNHIQIGDMVTLDLGELGKDLWQVIGIYEPVFASAYTVDTIYAPLEALFAVTKKHNQGNILYVRTTSHAPEFAAAVTAKLKDLYESHKFKTADSQTQAEARSSNEFQFSTVTWMLLSLSIIVAVVGGIALMGALSIGVVERTREIGVLRAVGARSYTILGVFVMEGILQGVMSWLAAVPLSFLVSGWVANSLGEAMFGATLDYQYNWLAVGAWLGIILVVSTLASILPARRATHISVRDSLAYA